MSVALGKAAFGVRTCPKAGHVRAAFGRGGARPSSFEGKQRVGTVCANRFGVMKNDNHRIRQTGMRRGSIAMEYVVVLSGIAVALVVFVNRAFYSVSEGFGPLGQGIVAFYQRLQGGLALPIP